MHRLEGMRRRLGLLLAVLGCGCLPRAVTGAFVARTASEASGAFGWFRADRDAPGGAYADHFEPLGERLDAVGCAELGHRQGDPTRPIYVLVHGVGGDGPEMQRTLPTLLASRPASVFMFRWVPWDEREVLVARLSAGLSRLALCIPAAPGRIVVIAHSAGGVLASIAVSRVAAPHGAASPWLTLLTVGAPLSGTLSGPLREHDPDLMFYFDLGVEPHYPKPAAGVRVLHLRTAAPADAEMKPRLGHRPNDPRVGVPGARQVDLPRALTHAGALVYVARRLADGSFEHWLDEDAP